MSLRSRGAREGGPRGVATTFSDTLSYDEHGSLTQMAHLPLIEWDHANRMQHANKGGGGDVYFTYDATGQRVRKVWAHSGLVEERTYLGAFEVYRRHSTSITGTIDAPPARVRRFELVQGVSLDGGWPVLLYLSDVGAGALVPIEGKYALDAGLPFPPTAEKEW